MQKKYICIVKISNHHKDITDGRAFWMRYNKVTDLLKFTAFLDKTFGSNWLYYNVEDGKGSPSLDHFTRFKRPHSKHI